MFNVGELIVYGNTGVCRIERIMRPEDSDFPDYFDSSRCYYAMKPQNDTSTIYTPTDNKKVFMRRIISANEANRLIDLIPTIKAEAFHSSSLKELKEHYQSATNTHDCGDLIELIMSIYAKSQLAKEHNRRLGQIDTRYMQQAEQLLYGEFSAVLGMEPDQVKDYIQSRVGEN